MEDRITSGQIRVKCRFTFITIYHCRIHAEYGKHTCAEITGTVRNRAAKAALNNIADEKVEIFSTDEEGKEEEAEEEEEEKEEKEEEEKEERRRKMEEEEEEKRNRKRNRKRKRKIIIDTPTPTRQGHTSK